MPALTPQSLSARQVLRKAIPKVVCDLQNIAITADTDVPGGQDLEPTDTPCTWRIQVQMDGTAKFYAEVTTSGGTANILKLNAGVDLTGDCVYTFDLMLHAGDVVSFQSDTSLNLVNLRVQEIIWGGI